MEARNALVAAALALACAAAFAAGLAKSDREFLEKAAAGGVFEIEAGKLAEKRALKPEVKAYGAILAKDHAKANEDLKALAAAKGVTLPAALPADLQKKLDKLARTRHFDSEYLQDVGLKDHRKDIALFEKAARNAKDKEVKAFAAKTLPLLKAHREHADGMVSGKT
jgi:putative membrane protein